MLKTICVSIWVGMVAVALLSTAIAQKPVEPAKSNSNPLPSRVSLYDEYMRYHLPAQNQMVGDRNDTCWDYAVIGALELELSRAKGETVQISGFYMEWAADQTDRTSPDHQGSNFGRATRALEQYGVCPLALCPQSARSVTQSAIDAALFLGSGIVIDWVRFWRKNKPGEELSNDELLLAKQRLANGHPIAVGLCWPKDLKIVSPEHLIGEYDDADVIDGHCVTLAGYEDNPDYPGGGTFIIRNTWGTGWQANGFARMSYNYFRHYANDLLSFHVSTRDVAAIKPTSKAVTNICAFPVHKLTARECTSREPGLLVTDNLARYKKGYWLNDNHVFFGAVHLGSEFSFKLNVPKDGDYTLKIAGTQAPDFGIYSFTVGSTKVGSPIDFSAVSVRPTGPISIGVVHCSKGDVICTVRCESKSFESFGYRLGLDWVSLEPATDDH